MATKDPQGSADTFMTLLRRHRIAKGLTQAALAAKLDVSAGTVSYWESGAFVPHPKLIRRLARILGVDTMTLTRLIEPEMVTAGK